MSTDKPSFLEDANSTGLDIFISFGKGQKTQILFRSRTKPGEPLNEISINDASDAQLNAICDVLDNL